jgi:hypothetical protein
MVILEEVCEEGGQGEGGGDGGLAPFTRTGSSKSYAATYMQRSTHKRNLSSAQFRGFYSVTIIV